MSTFSYVAVDRDKTVKGRLEAPSIEAARAALTAKGMFVTSLQPAKSLLQGEIKLFKKLPLSEQAWLARQLAVLTGAGMGLPAALGILAKQRKNKPVGKLAEQMRTELLAGRSPSAVTALHEEELGSMFVSMVAAGERAGVLNSTLNQLAQLLETKASLRKKTRAALTYPSAVVVITFVLALVILMVIVPIFGKMFASFGAKLPGPTLVLVHLSHFFTSHWYAIPLILLALGAFAWWAPKQESIAYYASMAGLRLPIIGPLLSKSALARVSSTIAMMMGAGTEALTVLSYAAQSTSNRVWSTMLGKVPDLLRKGRNLSESIVEATNDTVGTDTNFEVLAQMVEVGEQSGATPEVLGNLAKAMTEDVETGLSTLESSLEPLLIVIVGTVVGSMIVSLYLPIFHIITVLGNQSPTSGG